MEKKNKTVGRSSTINGWNQSGTEFSGNKKKMKMRVHDTLEKFDFPGIVFNHAVHPDHPMGWS